MTESREEMTPHPDNCACLICWSDGHGAWKGYWDGANAALVELNKETN